MVREETLRALISARETLSESMRDAAEGTRDLREAMAESSVSSAEFVGAMAATEEETDSLERAVETLSRNVEELAVSSHLASEGIDEAGLSAAQSAALMELYEGRVEEVGEESREAAAESMGLAAALRAVGAAAGEASVNVGPFNTNVRRAVVALPVLIALSGSFLTVLTGITVAATGAAGALALLFTAGLIGRAEEMARHSAEIENRMEALEEIFTRVGGALDQVTEPIQDLGQQQMAMSVLAGIVTLIGDLANSAKVLAPVFGEVGDRLDDVFWAEAAAGIAELEQLIIELMPILEQLTFYVLTRLPDFIAWLREETLRVSPAMGSFAESALEVVQQLTELGGTIFSIVLPPLTILLDVLGAALQVLSAVPESAYAAALAFAAVAVALTVYSGAAFTASAATWSLDAALATLYALLSPLIAALSTSTVAIAGVAAAVVGLITYFDLWDDIIDGIIDIWNTFIGIIQWGINVMIKFRKVFTALGAIIGLAIPPLGAAIILISNLGTVMDIASAATEKLGEMFAWLAQQYEDHIKPIGDEIGGLVDQAQEWAQTADSVDLSGAQIDQRTGPTGDEQKARERADRGRGARAQRRADELREERREYKFDFSGASFGSDMSNRDIERAIEQALKEQESRTSDT